MISPDHLSERNAEDRLLDDRNTLGVPDGVFEQIFAWLQLVSVNTHGYDRRQSREGSTQASWQLSVLGTASGRSQGNLYDMRKRRWPNAPVSSVRHALRGFGSLARAKIPTNKEFSLRVQQCAFRI
jgi:hypothetical protein